MDFSKRILMVFAFTIMMSISSVHCRQSSKFVPWFGEKFTQCFDSSPCRQGMLKCIQFCSSMGTVNGQCNKENICCCIH
ncbi:hypothetical protein N665_0025s0135 [Sinapis alba]|nr:hypothetical protein N665_0025s0135 [Sinapis alba]